MKQVKFFASGSGPSVFGVVYDLLGGGDSGQGSVAACAAVLRNLRVSISTAPGVGNTWTFTVKKNGANTAMVVTISGTATTADYTASDISIAEGDFIELFNAGTGSPAGSTWVRWSVEHDSTATGQSTYSGHPGGGFSGTIHTGVFNMRTWNTTPEFVQSVCPLLGTITKFFLKLGAFGLSGGDSILFTIYKNDVAQDGSGGTPDTRKTLTAADAGGATVSVSFSLAVIPGDRLRITAVKSGSAGGVGEIYPAIQLTATTNGQSVVCGVGNDLGTTAAQEQFAAPLSYRIGWSLVESTTFEAEAGITSFGLKHLFVVLSGAPGSGGDAWTFHARRNDANPVGGQTVTITNAATSGSDIVGVFTVVSGDTLSFRHIPSVSPATGITASWGMIQEIGVVDPGNGNGDGEGAHAGTSGLIEMCFHRGTSFRTWIKYRGLGDVLVAARFWWLGDVQTTTATDDIHEAPQFGAFGTYEVIPTKARGLIPEYGLATYFDGAVQRVSTLSGLTGTGGMFTLIALCQPAAGGLGAAQCIYQTGAVGSAYLGINASNQAVFGVNGGTLIASSLELEADHIYLVVGSYDGSNGTLFAVECEGDAVIDETGPTALTFTADHDLGTIGSNENTEFFEGAIQHVAELEDVLDLEDVEGLHTTTYWTDVTPDVEGLLTSDIGIHDDNPLARIAATGQLRITMDNSALNSAGLEGYYSPDHVNCREGFQRGIPIRFSLFDQGSPTERRIQFIGTIRSIRPTPGIYLERRTAVLGTDWIDEAARSTLRAIAVKTNVTADQVVGHILNSMRNRPHDIDLQTGSDTYVRALHNATDEKTTGQAELLNVALSELGLIYVRGDGTLVFESRTTRAGDTDLDYTLTDFLTVDQDDAADQAKNLIKVTAHPSRVSDDPVGVLYSNDATGSPADPAIQLDNGVNLEVFLPFRDLDGQETVRVGAVEIVTPVATTDYLINTSEDGSGSNVTGNSLITLSFTLGGNGVYLRASNQYGQRVWLTFLQIRGRAVYDFEPITAIAKNDNNIDEIGEQELALDMPYQSQVGIAQGAADFLLNSLRERQTRLKSVTFWGDYSDTHRDALINGDISTRIDASELMSGIDGEYFVNAKRIEWKPSGDEGLGDLDVTFHLSDASIFGQFWVLDESALDQTTRLAYL